MIALTCLIVLCVINGFFIDKAKSELQAIKSGFKSISLIVVAVGVFILEKL